MKKCTIGWLALYYTGVIGVMANQIARTDRMRTPRSVLVIRVSLMNTYVSLDNVYQLTTPVIKYRTATMAATRMINVVSLIWADFDYS